MINTSIHLNMDFTSFHEFFRFCYQLVPLKRYKYHAIHRRKPRKCLFFPVFSRLQVAMGPRSKELIDSIG
jgi:hypothetical protein